MTDAILHLLSSFVFKTTCFLLESINNRDSGCDVNVYSGQCVSVGADEEVGGCCSGWPYDAMFWQRCYETA